MGRRHRQRVKLTAPVGEYADDAGNVLVLRGSLTPAARREYMEVLAGGLDRDDARQRGIELLFERLAISWTVAGLTIDRQKELLGRYRMGSPAERESVLASLRTHVADNFPELETP
ncbi:MAG: hypothetical protein WAL63_14235 [Solirubrobacteraceae bacterium]